MRNPICCQYTDSATQPLTATESPIATTSTTSEEKIRYNQLVENREHHLCCGHHHGKHGNNKTQESLLGNIIKLLLMLLTRGNNSFNNGIQPSQASSSQTFPFFQNQFAIQQGEQTPAMSPATDQSQAIDPAINSPSIVDQTDSGADVDLLNPNFQTEEPPLAQAPDSMGFGPNIIAAPPME